jgi:hypothetical protein
VDGVGKECSEFTESVTYLGGTCFQRVFTTIIGNTGRKYVIDEPVSKLIWFHSAASTATTIITTSAADDLFAFAVSREPFRRTNWTNGL